MLPGSSFLLVLWLLVSSPNVIHGQNDEDNEFLENSSALLNPDPNFPALDCPKDCRCTQEGVVDCGGIDLKEFPMNVPELTNHLSLQVREYPAGWVTNLPGSVFSIILLLLCVPAAGHSDALGLAESREDGWPEQPYVLALAQCQKAHLGRGCTALCCPQS